MTSNTLNVSRKEQQRRAHPCSAAYASHTQNADSARVEKQAERDWWTSVVMATDALLKFWPMGMGGYALLA